MSKLKLMYDVISTMKEKEAIRGIFQAEVKRDQIKIFDFTNEFEKNLTNGQTSVKIRTELDCDGKKVNHESHTEFTMQNCGGHRHYGFIKHIHAMHHHGQHNNCQNHEDIECGGIKEKLTKLAYILNMFNQIKVHENEDESVVLSLNLDDIPDDLKRVFQERLNERKMPEHHPHHGFMKEFCNLKTAKVGFNVLIKKTREIEKITLTIDGKGLNELNENQEMSLLAELRLA